MGRRSHYILALFFFPAVFCLDFSGTRVSRKTQSLHMDVAGQTSRSAVEVSDYAHMIKKRSADDSGNTCNSLQGYNAKLHSNTHSVSLNRLFQLHPCHLTFAFAKLSGQAL